MKPPMLRQKNISIQINRNVEGSFIDGEYQVTKVLNYSIKVNMQPASGYQVVNLPEGKRDKKALNIYTKDISCLNSDNIIVDNETFEIINLKKYGNHTEIFCVGVPKNAIK